MAHRYNAIYNALQINAIHRYNGVAVGERAAGDEARFGGRGVGAVRRIAAREYPRRYADQALMIRPSRRVAVPVPGLLFDGIRPCIHHLSIVLSCQMEAMRADCFYRRLRFSAGLPRLLPAWRPGGGNKTEGPFRRIERKFNSHFIACLNRDMTYESQGPSHTLSVPHVAHLAKIKRIRKARGRWRSRIGAKVE